jgi:hypothetical protein
VPVVWQWQRNRDRRNRRGRNAEPRVVGTEAVDLASPDTNPLSDPEFVSGLQPIPAGSPGTPAPWPASDIHGVNPSGDAIEIRLSDRDGQLLLAFLNTDCDGCEEFWRGFQDPEAAGVPADTSVVVITKGPEILSSDDVRALAAGIRVPVVMGDQAWLDYRVLGYPFFVLVERASRLVVGETVGLGWDDVLSMTGRSP